MDYTVKKSKRKTYSISVGRDGTVEIKAPLKRSKTDIEKILKKYSPWIEKNIAKQSEKAKRGRKLTEEEIADLKSNAKIILAEKTRYYKKIIGVEPTGVKITSATTRWGSCSGTNSICYSYRVMLLSNRAQDYIVVHELCHILQKNHSPKFYREVAKILPDYKDRIKEIKNFSNFDLYG